VRERAGMAWHTQAGTPTTTSTAKALRCVRH
jgi:hypothetical protein